ncbi:hypothetical protein EU545_05110 [Candidatus Thorarchaeota archaeon]|nr:MAG: hypothetical protein EU545_05110 [Candidatus Thorarchaeota archaeon]
MKTLQLEVETRYWQIGNLLSPLVLGIISALLSIPAGDVEDVFTAPEYPKLLSPAPITFAIWGPIFIFLAVFYLYQAKGVVSGEVSKEVNDVVQEVGPFFILSSAATTAWYLLWLYRIIWASVLSMFLYLVFILGAYLRLGINRRERTLGQHVRVTIGWSMYAGWVTVAAIVNATTGLVATGFRGPIIGEVGWTILVLLMALVIYLAVLFTRNDFVYAGVGIWALIGSWITWTTPTAIPNPTLATVALVGIVVLLVAGALRLYLMSESGQLSIFQKLEALRSHEPEVET